MDAQTEIVEAIGDAARTLPLELDVLVESGVDVSGDYPIGFAAIDLIDVVSERVNGDRVGRSPARTVMKHDCLIAALINAPASGSAGMAQFKQTVLTLFCNAVANSPALRKLSFEFWVNRVTFRRLIAQEGREVAEAACQIRVIYRAYANDSATAILPQ